MADSTPTVRAVRRRATTKPVRSWMPTVRFTEQERQLIDQLRGNASYSSYIRQVALGRRPPTPVPQVNQQTLATLARLAANLNQLLKQWHQARKTGATFSAVPIALIQQLLSVVNQARQELRRVATGEALEDSTPPREES